MVTAKPGTTKSAAKTSGTQKQVCVVQLGLPLGGHKGKFKYFLFFKKVKKNALAFYYCLKDVNGVVVFVLKLQ